MIILAPAGMAPCHFDDLKQQRVWPLRDNAGRWLALALPHDDGDSSLVGAMDAASRRSDVALVAALALAERDRLILRPLSVSAASSSPAS